MGILFTFNQKALRGSWRSLPLVLLFLSFLTSCASTGSGTSSYSLPFDLSTRPAPVRKVWSKRASGLISDLNLARDSGRILIATVPDPEDTGSSHRISVYGPRGKLRWSAPLESSVRAQDISSDGKLAVLSTYDNRLSARDEKGELLWSVEAFCKPMILNQLKKVLCFNEDAVQPSVGFEIFGWDGVKSLSYAVERDVLALEVSDDEASIALGLTGGKVVLLSSDFKPVWEKKLEGEIADLAVSGEHVAVLHNSLSKGQKITLLGKEAKVLAERRPEAYVRQLELSVRGDAVATYGNGPKGQYLTLLGSDLKQRWQRVGNRIADYASPMVLRDELIIIGFEDTEIGADSTSRVSHLLAFDLEGKLKWNIPVVTEEGAYIYTQAFAPEKGVVVIGRDDGILESYSIGDH